VTICGEQDHEACGSIKGTKLLSKAEQPLDS
jgi:hypothetical protein